MVTRKSHWAACGTPCNLSTQEVERGDCHNFRASQGHRVRPCVSLTMSHEKSGRGKTKRKGKKEENQDCSEPEL